MEKINNFYKALIKENMKYIKFKHFFRYFTYSKIKIKGSPKILVKAKGAS